MSDLSEFQLISVIKELLPEFELTENIERLNGGNINVVWRLEGKQRNLIAKYAPPYLTTNPEIPLSNERIEFEARAMRELNKGGNLYEITSSTIRPPELYAYNKIRSFILMEDVGDFHELREASGSPQKIGERLGTFIGKLHGLTFENQEFANRFHNIEIQNVRNKLQYQPAWEFARLDDLNLSNEIKKKSQNLGNRLLKTGKCLVMGDLWPPSVYVGMENEIRLIDWEFVHFGQPLQDVGHFAAHCWMQKQVEGLTRKTDQWNTLWEFFLEAYKNTTGSKYKNLMNDRELNDIGVHIGTEILIRTFGPFKNSYIYKTYKSSHKLLQESRKHALDFILDAEITHKEFDF